MLTNLKSIKPVGSTKRLPNNPSYKNMLSKIKCNLDLNSRKTSPSRVNDVVSLVFENLSNSQFTILNKFLIKLIVKF